MPSCVHLHLLTELNANMFIIQQSLLHNSQSQIIHIRNDRFVSCCIWISKIRTKLMVCGDYAHLCFHRMRKRLPAPSLHHDCLIISISCYAAVLAFIDAISVTSSRHIISWSFGKVGIAISCCPAFENCGGTIWLWLWFVRFRTSALGCWWRMGMGMGHVAFVANDPPWTWIGASVARNRCVHGASICFNWCCSCCLCNCSHVSGQVSHGNTKVTLPFSLLSTGISSKGQVRLFKVLWPPALSTDNR